MKKSMLTTLGLMTAVGSFKKGLGIHIPNQTKPYTIKTTKNGKKIRVYK